MKTKLFPIISLILTLIIVVFYISCSLNNPFSAEKPSVPFDPDNASNGDNDSPSVNHAPVILSFTADPSTIHSGQNTTLTVTASDEDGDTLSYVYSFNQGSGTFSGSGSSVTATVNSTGANIIKAKVTDGKGGEATKTVDLTTENQSPNITSFTAQQSVLVINNSTTLNCLANDPDSDSITYAYQIIKGSGLISGSGNSVTYTAPSTTGTNRIKVTVSDSYSGEASLTLDIVSLNPPSTPGNFNVWTISSTSIGLSWDAVPGADSYKIYHSTSSSGPFIFLTSTSGIGVSHNSLNSETTHYYKVSSVNILGESPLSTSKNATTRLTI